MSEDALNLAGELLAAISAQTQTPGLDFSEAGSIRRLPSEPTSCRTQTTAYAVMLTLAAADSRLAAGGGAARGGRGSFIDPFRIDRVGGEVVPSLAR
jgi:hypothetical protein